MTKKYTLYFSFYGKKMKTTILAENEQAAKERVRQKIMFDKVEEAGNNECNDSTGIFDDIVEMLLGKKK